jgi:hypothetical protein
LVPGVFGKAVLRHELAHRPGNRARIAVGEGLKGVGQDAADHLQVGLKKFSQMLPNDGGDVGSRLVTHGP